MNESKLDGGIEEHNQMLHYLDKLTLIQLDNRLKELESANNNNPSELKEKEIIVGIIARRKAEVR